MGEFFGFVISFFAAWNRVAGLSTIVLAAGFLAQWIYLLYIPLGMQDIDQPVICCGILIMVLGSWAFFLMEPEG